MDTGFSLLVKYLSQSLSSDEMQELDAWRMLSEENNRLFSEMCKLKLLREYQQRNNVIDTALTLAQLHRKIRHARSVTRLRSALKYVAVAVLLFSLTLFGWIKFVPERYLSITVAEHESVKRVQLEDGSTVWLRSSSTLHIPKSFSPSHREVSLVGRAFFDVQSDEENPFIVKGKQVNIKVVGTSFDLLVDPKEKMMEAILVTGKIELVGKRGDKLLDMRSGEMVTYHSDKNQFTIKEVDTNTYTAWYLDQITFDNATLREIVDKLNLIYKVNINIESTELAQRRYRLVINREESLTEVLENLKFLTPIQFRIEGKEVFITK